MGRARTVRKVSVGTTPVQIRDTTKPPVERSIYRYPSGGGVIYLGTTSDMTSATGKTLSADSDYTDFDQSLTRYMLASTGTIVVEIEDFES